MKKGHLAFYSNYLSLNYNKIKKLLDFWHSVPYLTDQKKNVFAKNHTGNISCKNWRNDASTVMAINLFVFSNIPARKISTKRNLSFGLWRPAIGQDISKISIASITQMFHILHFLAGFIGEPTGQLKASANSGTLCNNPFTLKYWLAKLTTFRKVSCVHHLKVIFTDTFKGRDLLLICTSNSDFCIYNPSNWVFPKLQVNRKTLANLPNLSCISANHGQSEKRQNARILNGHQS